MIEYDSSDWFYIKHNKKNAINRIEVYKKLSRQIGIFLEQNWSFSDVLDWLKKKVIEEYHRRYCTEPKTGALNNASGYWNEYIVTRSFSEISLLLKEEYDINLVIFNLPDSDGNFLRLTSKPSRFLELFREDEYLNNAPLYPLKEVDNSIFFSSPDYVIACLEEETYHSLNLKLLLQEQIIDPTQRIIFDTVKGNLLTSEIQGVISLKTSNRPDRRYQPLYEADVIKAIAYITNLDWKYYMVTTNQQGSSDADIHIFRHGIAPCGIALGKNIKAVDGQYSCFNKEDLKKFIFNVF